MEFFCPLMLRPDEDSFSQVPGPISMLILLQADLPSPLAAPMPLAAAAGRWCQQNQRISLVCQAPTIKERGRKLGNAGGRAYRSCPWMLPPRARVLKHTQLVQILHWSMTMSWICRLHHSCTARAPLS